jgi:hypothetical protein
VKVLHLSRGFDRSRGSDEVLSPRRPEASEVSEATDWY